MEWLFSAHKAHTSSLSQPNTRTELESHKSHKEKVEERFYRFGSSKTAGEAHQQPKSQQPQQVELVGYLYPTQEKLAVRKATGGVRPLGQGG
jgi:hypothetical protein